MLGNLEEKLVRVGLFSFEGVKEINYTFRL